MISVLMSVYNEKRNEIDEAVQSVLDQTFSDFELIIVNDNPCKPELAEHLDVLKKKDDRIRILSNEQNIGLALSMNRAAAIAKGDLYLRMDADDVCELNRFETEYQMMISKNADLVFSNYVCIDENSEYLYDQKPMQPFIKDEDIPLAVATIPVIHHPTVLMTKAIFDAVGGYRDFPCSQDQDLWLRLLDKGCRFTMCDQVLLRYRLRDGSISREKKLMQHMTIDYIRDLFWERIHHAGQDSYSKENYLHYLEKRNYQSKQKHKNMQRARALLLKSKNEKNRLKALMQRILAVACSSVYRRTYFLRLIRTKKIHQYVATLNN